MIADVNTQELKAAAPIIPYIRRFYSNKIVIEKEGDNVAFAKCIFHDENTASLAFYANGTYKCFGCGEHGDLITLVQKLENVDFQTACIIIANNVGYNIQFLETNPEWEKYKDALDEHTRRYWVNLQHDANALNYLVNERRITPEMINTFRLGLTDREEYKYRTDMNNISYKITFPILEHKRWHPKCVGLAYRGLTDEKPKYINDKNQTGRDGQNKALEGVFIKGNMLYGLAQAYEFIQKNDFVFIVEGYFDVISMHQSGLTNTVSIMGTSFTEEQIKTVSKITKNVFLLLDNDKAGKNAINRYLVSLLRYDIRPMICTIGDYKDPDEMCKAFNFDNIAICNFLKEHMGNAVHYMIMQQVAPFKERMSRERTRIYNDLYNIISEIPNPAIRNAFLKELDKELW